MGRCCGCCSPGVSEIFHLRAKNSLNQSTHGPQNVTLRFKKASISLVKKQNFTNFAEKISKLL